MAFRDERIIFMGTPEFAVASLSALIASGCNVVAVITAPDRPSGRGMKLQPSAVKAFAVQHGLPVLQPTNLRSEAFLEELQSFKATLQVVVAFRMLPQAVWAMPPKGTFNLHASLLPQFRGAAPINHAIISGATETGVTTFFLEQEIDTGNIILQEKTPIGPEETAGELHDRLMAIGARLVVETVRRIATGNVATIPQTGILQEELFGAPKIFKDFCRIDWGRSAADVFNHIRGLSPYPSAFTEIRTGDEVFVLKIFRSQMVADSASGAPGQLSSDGRTFLYVQCKDGQLSLLEVQLSGKRRMAIGEFLKGFDIAGTAIKE
jgi:methionyl-tRNA formyltransferase